MREDGDLLLRAVVRTLTQIDETDETEPQHFVLQQNYPNPFNSSTTISFELKMSGFYIFEIYDIQGELVKAWPFFQASPGPHSFVWDGTQNEQPVHSGVYFGKLSGESQTACIRMLLVK